MKNIIKTFVLTILVLAGIVGPISTHADSKDGIEVLGSNYNYPGYYSDDYIWEEYYRDDYDRYYPQYNIPLIGYGYYQDDLEEYAEYDHPTTGYMFYLEDMRQNPPQYVYYE